MRTADQHLEEAPEGKVAAVVEPYEHGVETRYISVAYAARLMKVSRMTMYRRIHNGDVRSSRFGNKIRVFLPDIERLSRPVYLNAEELD